jgi:membrane protease YdiL (CAAX protease family)
MRHARSSLVAFFIAAAVVSGVGFSPVVVASWRGAAAVPAWMRPLQLLMLFGPGLLACTWAWREGRWPAVRALLARVLRWRVAPRWYAAVLLGPPLVYVASVLLARAAGTSVALPAVDAAFAAFAPSFLLYLLLNTEELAWRGYAWPRLRDRFGALRGSLLLGVLWGLLHFPLFLMKGGHPGGFPPALFLAMTTAFSVLFALAFEGSGGSVLIAHLLHQSLNAWGDALPIYPRAAGSVVPVAALVALSVAIAAWGAWRARWRWSGGHHGAAP